MAENLVNQDGTAQGEFTNSGGALGKTRFVAGSPTQLDKADKPAAPVHQQGNVRYRMQVGMDGTTGPLEVSTHGGATRQAGPDPVKATAIGAQGQRISLSEAGPETVIDLGGALGSTQATVWEGLGYIERDPSGRGYRVVGQQQNPSNVPAPPSDQPAQQKPAADAPVNPADVAGVPATSAEADAFQSKLEAKGAVYESVITQIAKNQPVDWASLAESAGEDPADFTPKAEGLHGELIASGQAVLRNVGVENPEAFQTWATTARPEQANEAVRAMLARDVSKLAQLGREYTADRAQRIASIGESKGVATKIQGGVVYFDRGSLGLNPISGRGDFATSWISEAAARELGVVEISE